MLASEWTPIDDTTWEFTLQDGVTFHDGSPFDAEDVKASIELASGKQCGPGRRRRGPERVGRRMGPDRGRDRGRPHRSPRQRRAIRGACSRSCAAPSSSARMTSARTSPASAAAPNGTGPFKLVRDEVGKKVMEANADYWRGAPQIRAPDLGVHPGPGDPPERAAHRPGRRHRPRAAAAPRQHRGMPTGSRSPRPRASRASTCSWPPAGSRSGRRTRRSARRSCRPSTGDGLVDGLVQGSSTVATSFLPTETPGPRGRRARLRQGHRGRQGAARRGRASPTAAPSSSCGSRAASCPALTRSEPPSPPTSRRPASIPRSSRPTSAP